jgi:signal transduction histidine kinase
MNNMSPLARLWRAVLGVPVSVKVMAISLSVALCIGVGLFWQIHKPYSELEEVEVEDYARFMGQVVAVGAGALLRSGQGTEVQHLLDDMALVTPTIGSSLHKVKVVDGQGKVLAEVTHPLPVSRRARVLAASAELPAGVPGRVSMEINDNHINFELAWHTRRIFMITAWVAVLGLFASWGLMRLVTRPIGELARVARAVRAGDYGARARVQVRDELGELATSFNQMLEALQQKHAENRQLLRKLIAAEEEERKRVARELHDQTGQHLTALIAGLTAAEGGQGTSPGWLTELRGLATETLREVHDLSLGLRPVALEELGLVAALQKHCRSVTQRSGVVVDCAGIGLEDAPRLPVETEVALYRVVQEALTNAVRHGQARSVHVLLHRQEAVVQAVVEDNGRGFDAKEWRAQCLNGDHLGLLGIDERARLLGGTFRVESHPGTGTSLFIEIPLPAKANEPNTNLAGR